MEKPDIVYLDLETQHSLYEVGGWRNINKLRVSIGVTFSTALNKYTIYWEPTVHQLIHQLTKAHLIVGFNLLKFDYKVLQAYTSIHLAQLPTLDIMADISQRLHRPVSLNSIVKATLELEKTADGLQAVQWFKQNKLVQIAEYCCYDVKLAMLIHQFGLQNGFVYVLDKQGNKQLVKVDWCPRQDSNLYGVTH